MRIRNLSNPNAAKSKKKGIKVNRVKKKKINTSYATKSKVKLIGKSVLANRRNTKAF